MTDQIQQRAEDHALILREMCRGRLRWDDWGDRKRGELCTDGICHATRLDEFGCPELTERLRFKLQARGQA